MGLGGELCSAPRGGATLARLPARPAHLSREATQQRGFARRQTAAGPHPSEFSEDGLRVLWVEEADLEQGGTKIVHHDLELPRGHALFGRRGRRRYTDMK